MTFSRAFLLSMGTAIIVVPLLFGGGRIWAQLTAPAPPPAAAAQQTPVPQRALADKVAEKIPGQIHALGDGIAVREQITLAHVARIKADGYRTLIDLRPDGEATDQPPASAVGEAARSAGMGFAYVPTPHGDIPAATVDAFAKALSAAEKPVLLYCRSGSRAARVWALAEASRPEGADGETITRIVRGAGQKIDDLQPQIAKRIAARANQK